MLFLKPLIMQTISNTNLQILNLYLGGQSCEIKRKDLVKGTLHYAGSLLGYKVIDHTKEMDSIRGFQNLTDYINSQPGTWVINDTCPVHLDIDVKYIVMYREATWVWPTTLRGNCIGCITQSMICSPHGPMEIAQIILKDKLIEFPFKETALKTQHFVSDYAPGSIQEFARNAFAAHTWGVASLTDKHYELNLLDDERYVHKILEEAIEKSEKDDLIVMTNRDICLVPEFSAVLWAFMINRNLSYCYNHRVDITTQKPLTHKDIENHPQYQGIDTFAFINNDETRKMSWKLSKYPLLIGKHGWDFAWTKIIDNKSGFNRCPYNITYHVPHPQNWGISVGESKENEKIISTITDDDDIKFFGPNSIGYINTPWIF